MATYLKFARGNVDLDKRVWLVEGSESCLVHEVVDRIVAAVGAAPVDLSVVRAGESRPARIMDILMAPPLTGRRCVVIWDVDRLGEKVARGVADWIMGAPRDVWLILVGDLESESPLRQAVRKKGRVVECRALTAEELVEWVEASIPCQAGAAEWLVVRCGGETWRVRNELEKFRLLGLELTREVVVKLVPVSPAEVFVEALMEGQRKAALLAAGQVAPDEIGRVVGLIEHHLAQIALLFLYVREVKDRRADWWFDTKNVVARTGIPAFLLTKYSRWKKLMDHDRLRRRVMALAMADYLAKQGIYMGILERLASVW